MSKSMRSMARMFVSLVVVTVAIVPAKLEAAEWQEIWGDGTKVDSDCVGSAATPECLVDTLVACDVWSEYPGYYDHDEFRPSPVCSVIGSPAPYGILFVSLPRQLVHYRYRVEPQVLKESDIPDWAREGSYFARLLNTFWRPGDRAMDLWMKHCRPCDDCIKEARKNPGRVLGAGYRFDVCIEHSIVKTFILRRDGERWRVAGIYNPADPGTRKFYWKRK